MATLYSGKIILHKLLISCWSKNLRCYGCTGIRLTNASASRKGNKTLHKPVLNEGDSDKKLLDSVYPHILFSVTRCNDIKMKPAVDHFKSAIEHIVAHGQMKRALLILAACRLLTPQQTQEQLLKVCIMGWCAEMLQASVLMSDDISDNSITRRGRPCWHRLENVGITSAVCDILTLESGVYQLLKMFFQEEHYYSDVVDLFHDITMTMMTGQTLDIWISRQNLDEFNQDNYNAICRYKTAEFTSYFPLALAMHMVAIPDKEVLEVIKEICLQIGQLYQVKNDYKDCFGDPNVSKKIGNDIEEGKCTWFIINALKLANEEERILLKKCYGKRDPELTKLVYNKYVELQLDTLFVQYEQETYDAIKSAIGQLPLTCPTNVLYHSLDILN